MRQTYVALLRAINVGGNSVIKMADLRTMLESLGFEDVTTYIQTGNVVFSAEKAKPEEIARAIEEKIADATGHTTIAFVLTPAQLKQAAARNPFVPPEGDDGYSHLMFLSRAPSAAQRSAIKELEGDEYSFHVQGKVFYFAYPRSAAGRRRRAIDFEKILDASGTSRTWKVVDKLIELSA